MIGHESIIAMRKRGRRPAIVFVNDYPAPSAKDWANPGEKYAQVWPSDHATVCTDGDVIQLLDLRYLVGLRVSISATSEIRAKALFEQAKHHGAETVAACHVQPQRKPWEQSGWAQVWHKTEVSHG